jgi:glyoxylase-like metal-dependent hydrolase (beta-lactamase superfamily II)
MEIAKGIHRIECIFDGNRMAAVHLLVGERASMLVDTCVSYNVANEILPYMESIGFDPASLTYVVISHSDSDHQGGMAPMREAAPKAIFMCHSADEPWITDTMALVNGRYKQFDEPHGFETPDSFVEQMQNEILSTAVDMTLEGGERFNLSDDWTVEIVHTPGHSWGHLAVYDPRSKALVANEAALWNAILDMDMKPCMIATYCYADTYLATIDRLLAMDIEIFSPAHWEVQHGAAVAEFLRESRNFCLNNERLLLEMAGKGPFTLQEAIKRLARQIGDWPPSFDGAMVHPFNANLERLIGMRKLTKSHNDAGIVVYVLAG